MHLFRKNPEKRERKKRERQEAEQKKQDDAHLKREIHRARLETQGLIQPRFDATAARTMPRFDSAAGRTPWPFKNESTGSVGMKRYRSFGDQARSQISQPEDGGASTSLSPFSSSLPVTATPTIPLTSAIDTRSIFVTPNAASPAEKLKGLWDRLSPLTRKKSTTEPTTRGGITHSWVYNTLPRSWRSRHQLPSVISKGKGKILATTTTLTDNSDDPFRDPGYDYSSDSENPFASTEDDEERYISMRRAELPAEWASSVSPAGPATERYSRYLAEDEDDGYWNDPDNLDGPVLEQWALAERTLVEGYDATASRRESKRLSTSGLTWN